MTPIWQHYYCTRSTLLFTVNDFVSSVFRNIFQRRLIFFPSSQVSYIYIISICFDEFRRLPLSQFDAMVPQIQTTYHMMSFDMKQFMILYLFWLTINLHIHESFIHLWLWHTKLVDPLDNEAKTNRLSKIWRCETSAKWITHVLIDWNVMQWKYFARSIFELFGDGADEVALMMRSKINSNNEIKWNRKWKLLFMTAIVVTTEKIGLMNSIKYSFSTNDFQFI